MNINQSAAAANNGALPLPSQSIPVPASLSPQAQAYLAQASKRLISQDLIGKPTAGPLDQTAQAAAAVQLLRPMASGFKGAEETIDLAGGAQLHCMTPEHRQGRLQEVAFMDIHGGGFTSGGGEMCRLLAKIRARFIVPTLQRGNPFVAAPAASPHRWSGASCVPTLERGNDHVRSGAASLLLTVSKRELPDKQAPNRLRQCHSPRHYLHGTGLFFLNTKMRHRFFLWRFTVK